MVMLFRAQCLIHLRLFFLQPGINKGNKNSLAGFSICSRLVFSCGCIVCRISCLGHGTADTSPQTS